MNIRNSPKFNAKSLGSVALIVGIALVAAQSAAAQKDREAPPTVNVEVVNPTEKPIPVRKADNPAFQAVQHDFSSGSYLVPAGKRLVIEHVSFQVSTAAGCPFVRGSLRTTLNGETVTHRFFFNAVGSTQSGDTVYGLSTQTRLYADPDTTLFHIISVDSASCAGTLASPGNSISGYLVDEP